MSNEEKNVQNEKVERYVLGSVWWRALAFLIDFIIFYALVYGLYYLIAYPIYVSRMEAGTLANPERFIAIAFILVGLPAGFLAFCFPALFFKKGKTVGKKICKLQTISKDGKEITFFHLFFRFMVGLYALEYVTSCLIFKVIPFPLGYIVSGLIAYANSKHAAIHDVVSGTLVVEDKKTLVTLMNEEDEKQEQEDEENKPTNIKLR